MEFDSIKIDLTYFYSLTNADKAFELKLLTGTVADVNRLVNNLKNAWALKNAEAVKRNAHSLISLSAVVGIPMVESWCRKIENIFTDNQFHVEYEALLNNIVSVWSSGFPQLKEVLTTMLTEA
jgi:Hpt domain